MIFFIHQDLCKTRVTLPDSLVQGQQLLSTIAIDAEKEPVPTTVGLQHDMAGFYKGL